MRYDIESFEVPYARVKGRDLVLWVNKPKAKGNFPVFLDIHGGAWTHFDHKVDFVWCQELARRGFTVCSIDFRLAPDHPWPTFLCDVRAASRWVHAHGKEIGADASVMGAIGGSTGGHLSLLLGLQPNDPRGRVTPALDTPDDAPAGIDFVCANYPIVDVLARYQMVKGARFDPLTQFAAKQITEAIRRRVERGGGVTKNQHGPGRLGNPSAIMERVLKLREENPWLGNAVGWGLQRALDSFGKLSVIKAVEYPSIVAAHDGAYSSEAEMIEASPTGICERREFQALPSILIQQGHDDPNMSDEMTENFARAYRRVGGEVELLFLENHGHGFGNLPSPQADRMIDRAEALARRTMAKKRSPAFQK
ncbi:MAG: alpha/beta hydrolase, partial [Bdellovibrionota bacterium]